MGNKLALLITAASLAALLFSGCAGVFVNPDIAGGKSLPTGMNAQVQLPAIDPVEHDIYRSFRDSGVTRIPEHHYYAMQDFMLNALARHFKPDLAVHGFSEGIGQKDITRIYNQDSPRIEPGLYLKQLSDMGFSVYRLESCGPELTAGLLQSGLPILIYTEVTLKKFFRKDLAADATPVPVSDAAANPSTSLKQLFRKFSTFDLIYGYQKAVGPGSNRLPGEEGDQYIFRLRSALDIAVLEKKEMTATALRLYGYGNYVNAVSVPDDIYLVLPADRPLKEVWERAVAQARELGFSGAPAEPGKIF